MVWGRGLNLVDSRIERARIREEFYGDCSLVKCREANGLPPIKTTKRICLKCQMKFESEHIGIRTCVNCRTS
jgi:hypothetical protein